MRSWYVLHTQPHKERLVRDVVLGRGIQVYLPLVVQASSLRARRRREEPFFARYLFVRFDPQVTPPSSLHWMQGVTRLVSFGGEPAVVPDSVIAWLQERLDAQSRSCSPYADTFKANDRLRITTGPLAGLEVIFDRRLSSQNRARVFIEFMGRLHACNIPLDSLERVAEAAPCSPAVRVPGKTAREARR